MTRRNRSKIEIMVQILNAVNMDRSVGASTTRLMRRVQTSYAAVTRYLKELIDTEMVVFHPAENKYTVTQKGRILMGKYTSISKMMDKEKAV